MRNFKEEMRRADYVERKRYNRMLRREHEEEDIADVPYQWMLAAVVLVSLIAVVAIHFAP